MLVQTIVNFIVKTRQMMISAQNVGLQGGRTQQTRLLQLRRSEGRRPQVRYYATFQLNHGLRGYLCTRTRLQH
uniref:Uncharacterized protein n=1 Tax=Arundo donax TaxID=35708 RepID=A0A0A8ZGX1_ARUDO